MTGGASGQRLDEKRLRGLLDAGRALVEHLDLESLLDELLEVARELTGARYAAIGVLDERRRGLAEFRAAGIDPELHRLIGDPPQGRGVLGVLIDDRRPLRLADVSGHPASYGFPPHHPRMRTFLGVPILMRGEAWGNLYLAEKEGGEFDEADEQVATVLAEWASVAIGNARLYEHVESRRAELERTVLRLEATTAIARALGGETSLERVLELIVKRGRALLDARTLVIMLLEDDELVASAAAGEVAEGGRGARLPLAGSTSGEVLRSGRPRLIRDPARLRVPPERLGVRQPRFALIVPMTFRGRAVGVLAAFDRLGDGPVFDSDDESLLVSFAASAATAVATARSVEEARLRDSIAAAEQERRRWARELHDETLQALAALQILVSSARKAGDPAAMAAALEQAAEQIAQEIQSLRTLITELRPAALDEYGIVPALDNLTERVAAVNGLAIEKHVELGPDERLDGDLETTVYRVVQEALTNVAKHARAENVHISIGRRDGRLEVIVEDDGHGFAPHTAQQGFGLVGMRERVSIVGGTLEVRSSPTGTRVHALIPVPEPA
ncbi:MAG: GAF domain-containing sensor histidine kinase [Thermoleophilaceae bacterium]|nr:GAF domain-containing sensor histidine kinase [Thermoleophilaceae bacterium]